MQDQHLGEGGTARLGGVEVRRNERFPRQPGIPQKPIQAFDPGVIGARRRKGGVRELLQHGEHAITTRIETQIAEIARAIAELERELQALEGKTPRKVIVVPGAFFDVDFVPDPEADAA